jgi:hypothetical protein
MSHVVKGTFEVTSTPHPPYDAAPGAVLVRVSLAKTFEGPLAGTSTVEMIAARTEVAGSAGYVAIERVNATLEGKAGTFVLQHSGTMNRGAPSLAVTVVPDSATGELVGLRGQMAIDIVEGKHFYTFEYALEGAG